MKIIEWNCQGAFRKKNKEIIAFKADIIVIPECEQETKLQFGILTPQPNDFFWYGDTGKKGIGIFSYSNYRFKLLKEFNPKFRYILPLEVSDGQNTFLLFAVWAMDNKTNPLARYIGQVWLAINYYHSVLRNNSIIIGDFNSNQVWDEKDRIGNHTDVVNKLNSLAIESLYHKQYNEEHGKEMLKTFFMYRSLNRPYHIDYAFASDELIKNGYTLNLETSDKWIDKSDHVPMILEIPHFESKIELNLNYAEFINRHLELLTVTTKERFQEDISRIRSTGTLLDNNDIDHNIVKDIIWNIEVLKEIDRLSTELK